MTFAAGAVLCPVEFQSSLHCLPFWCRERKAYALERSDLFCKEAKSNCRTAELSVICIAYSIMGKQ